MLKLKRTPEGWCILNQEGKTHNRPYTSQQKAAVVAAKIMKGLVQFQSESPGQRPFN